MAARAREGEGDYTPPLTTLSAALSFCFFFFLILLSYSLSVTCLPQKSDEAWEGRIQSSGLRISQVVEIVAGCAVTVSHLPSPFFAPASPAPGREVRSWIGSTRRGKLPGQGCGFSGVPCRERDFCCSLCSWRLGQVRTVPHSVVGPPTFFVFLFIFVWARHGCRATNWRAVLAGRCSLDSGRLVC